MSQKNRDSPSVCPQEKFILTNLADKAEIGMDLKTKKSFRTLSFDSAEIVENMLFDMKAKQEEWK